MYGFAYHPDREAVHRLHLDNEVNHGLGLHYDFKENKPGVAFAEVGAYQDSGSLPCPLAADDAGPGKADDFPLMQEFDSYILGVPRVGVGRAAGQLQKRNLIVYSRGNIRIVDRRGLEAASCSCYQIPKTLH